LQVPHFPPRFAQNPQLLQFVHALQGVAPTQVAAECVGGCPTGRPIARVMTTMLMTVRIMSGARFNVG